MKLFNKSFITNSFIYHPSTNDTETELESPSILDIDFDSLT